jgi:hypothetical protein
MRRTSRNVPGRKTDVNDATWLAELLAHGLIRSSFVPPREVGELRTLLRTRKQLVREHASHVQRVQKTLEDANIKIASALSDIMGKSGRAMIEAMIAGETDPHKLAVASKPRVPSLPRRSPAGSTPSIAFFCGFTSARSMPSTAPRPRSTPRSRVTLPFRGRGEAPGHH